MTQGEGHEAGYGHAEALLRAKEYQRGRAEVLKELRASSSRVGSVAVQICDECGEVMRDRYEAPQHCPNPAHGEHYIEHPLMRRTAVSEVRVGSVAAEDWRTIAVQLASLLRELHPQNPYYREKQAEALAAFDALAGESNEGGNQNDERRH
jgi:hypothetical protein